MTKPIPQPTEVEALMQQLVWMVVFGIYFFPSLLALIRKRKHTFRIFINNLFLGITGVGWIYSLVWAITDPPAYDTSKRRYYNNYNNRHSVPAPPPPRRNTSLAEELSKLGELKKQGIVSEEEFSKAKQKIIDTH